MKAKEAAENAKGAMTAAANRMFAFYNNLLLVEASMHGTRSLKSRWKGNPYVDLQGISQKGPRGVSSQSFNNCMIFCLLAVFPINAAEQEKYYITNILKKLQCVNVHQFIHHVEQLNAYIVQMPCFYNSPSFNATTKLENVPFTEAEIGSHVLRIEDVSDPMAGPVNLHKKGMTPLDLCLLLTSLEAIESVCTQEKAKTESSKKASNRGKNGLVPNLRSESP
jgi:hypothetical protein